MEVELVLDDIERLVKNIRTFTTILKDMQKVVDELEHIKPKKEKKSKKTQTEPLEDLKPIEAELPEALVCEPIKKSKKMRKPKLERS
jgi:hypothetical protein